MRRAAPCWRWLGPCLEGREAELLQSKCDGYSNGHIHQLSPFAARSVPGGQCRYSVDNLLIERMMNALEQLHLLDPAQFVHHKSNVYPTLSLRDYGFRSIVYAALDV